MNELLRALRLAQTSTRRFRTLRATILDWADLGLIARANDLRHLSDEVQENTLTLRLILDMPPKHALWRDDEPCRAPIEDGNRVFARDVSSWWRLDKESGELTRQGEFTGDFFFHLVDARWIRRPGFSLRGRTQQHGRDAFALTAPGHAGGFSIQPGADRCEYAIDAERGVLLRAESRFRRETLAVEEMLEVAFDEELPVELFEVPA